MIGLAFDFEIEPPPPVDPGLSNVPSLVVFLGPKGGMAEILKEEGYAAVNGSSDLWRGVGVAFQEALGVDGAH